MNPQNAKIVLLGKFYLINAESPNNNNIIWNGKSFSIKEKERLIEYIKYHNINVTNKESFTFLK